MYSSSFARGQSCRRPFSSSTASSSSSSSRAVRGVRTPAATQHQHDQAPLLRESAQFEQQQQQQQQQQARLPPLPPAPAQPRQQGRRGALAAGAALATAALAAGAPAPARADAERADGDGSLLSSSSSFSPSPSSPPDTTVTARIFLDVGVARTAFKPPGERTLGDRSVLPLDDAAAAPVGRIVIGLYGRLAPATTANLVAAARAGAFNSTAFSRVLPGEYIAAGRQGSRRLGDVEPPPGVLQAGNADLASPGPFALTHARPGTVSLLLSEPSEDPTVRERPGYARTEFLITTGPGPVPRLDGVNPVIGRVEQGMDAVAAIARTPAFTPDVRSQQLNRFAAFLGDGRADGVRRQYGRPLKAVVILKAGVVGEEEGAAAAGAA